ncbi:MAG: RNA methyltransferase [Nitrospiraceae bacterium]|nr:MAG: RNA methyltransferase [Nitrospiraceae bacterium]
MFVVHTLVLISCYNLTTYTAAVVSRLPFLLQLTIMHFRKITALSNSKIRGALEIKKRRKKHSPHAFLLEGPHLIEMYLQSRCKPVTEFRLAKVFLTADFLRKKSGQKLLKDLSHETDEIFEVTNTILSQISDTETPQGIIAVGSYRSPALSDLRLKEIPLLVVIDQIQDPGNLGTIIRTADACGSDGIILFPGTCDVFTPKTIRATAGSIFNIPVVNTDLNTLKDWAQKKRISIAVAAARAALSVYTTDLTQPLAVVFGSEAHGVSTRIRQASSLSLHIPIYGKAESLNVASAAAVVLYETLRQRNRVL